MRILTWNMQGAGHSDENKWSSGVAPLFLSRNLNLDYACLQECEPIPKSAAPILGNNNFDLGIQFFSWNNKYVIFHNWDTGGNRNNLAIVCRNRPLAGYITDLDHYPYWRPAIGVRDPHFDLNIFSLHAISPGGADAGGLLVSIDRRVNSNEWIACGDYNQEPSKLGNVLYAQGIYVQINAPDYFTHSVENPRSHYDYSVSQTLSNRIGDVRGLNLSDHFPVLYVYW